MRFQLTFLGALLLIGCGRETTQTGYKLAGVGINPDEIDPSPTDYSGIISYDWIEFSGAALPLGLVGLVSFDGVGPSDGSPFEPPYAVVYASGLVMDGNLPATDALFGNFGVAPEVVGRCHTIYEPASYVSGLADVGTAIEIDSADGDAGVSIGRRPLAYPPDVQDIFPTYLALEAWREGARSYRLAPDGYDQLLEDMPLATLSRPNYPFGEQMSLTFPGALPPETATFSSIPVPSSVSEPPPHVLPTRPQGVMMTWDGPQYSSDGIELESGETSTCLQFVPHNREPSSPVDCLTYEDLDAPGAPGQFPRGQMYTPPWETDSGITFRWIVSEDDVDETVSITVRFLGELEEEDDNLVDAVVEVPLTAEAEVLWAQAQRDGSIPRGVDAPSTGRRTARACEEPGEDFEYLFDDGLLQGDSYVSSLQGSPFRNMAEVVCNVGDSTAETVEIRGEEYNVASFTLTTAILRDAITYGEQQGAKGAVFYFNRTTKTPLDLPDVRDYRGNKRNTGDVLLVSNAVQLGRFWLGEDGL
jgi:hypothetical protein